MFFFFVIFCCCFRNRIVRNAPSQGITETPVVPQKTVENEGRLSDAVKKAKDKVKNKVKTKISEKVTKEVEKKTGS